LNQTTLNNVNYIDNKITYKSHNKSSSRYNCTDNRRVSNTNKLRNIKLPLLKYKTTIQENNSNISKLIESK